MTAAVTPFERTGAMSLGVGSIVAGKYRVERVLGSGGMGFVVSAVHTALGQRVAIKILRTDIEHGKDEAVHRFMREARAAARIQSEHVARVVDIAELADGTPYMVMEYLEGSDLREVVAKRGGLPVAEAADYVLQACEALAEAHAAGIIHRDLKPSNLFLAKRANGTEVVKVLDFGISKYVPRGAEGQAGITSTNSLMGSPLYMAPEQMKSSRDVDARADIWALGTILYELLAGAPPFTGSTIPEVCIAVMAAVPRPMTQFRKDIPPQLQGLVLKCLARLPADRYATVATLARDLSRFAGARSTIHAERASAMMRSALVHAPASIRPDDGIPLSRDQARPELRSAPDASADDLLAVDRSEAVDPARRRKLALAFVAGLAAFVLIGGFAVRSLSPRPRDPVAAPASPPAEIPTPMIAPVPTNASDIATVPFDQLPHVPSAHPLAPYARAPVPPSTAPSIAPPSRSASAPPSVKAVAQPHPVSPSSSSPSDDWKWGDRN